MNTRLLLSVFLVFSFASFVSASEVCTTYDNFSSSTLDLTKWEEVAFHGDPFPSEHTVLVNENVYHVAQLIAGTGQVNLIPTRQFLAGDSFSYELLYYNGSGNHASQPLINGNYPPSQIEQCVASAGCGVIGFWNGLPDLGAQAGTYEITFEFFDNEVKMTTIKPDGSTVVNTFTGNSAPYEFAINTHTGHNGLMHFDYDNFILCTESEPQNPPSNELLLERIELLEQKVETLETKVSTLESKINKLINFIRNLPKGLRKHWNW